VDSDFALLNAVVDPIIVIDGQWRLVHFNPAANSTCEDRLAHFVGAPLWEVFPKLVGTGWEKLYREVMTQRVARQAELSWIDGTGWFDVSVSPMGDGILVQYRNRSREHEILEALRASEERYRRLMEDSTDAIWTTDENGLIGDVNEAAITLLGYSREELTKMKTRDIVVPSEIEDHLATRTKLALGQSIRTERSIVSRDGTIVHLEINAKRICDGCILSVGRDISERRQTEEALRESELTLQAVIRATPLAIETVDTDGRVIMWNPAAEAMFGWRGAEVLGERNPSITPDMEDEYFALLAAECQGFEVTGLEMRRRRKDGTFIDVVVSSAPLRDVSGEIRGVVSAISDVTERKRLEQQLLQAQKMDAIGRLAGGVAHDFNNLLTAISAYSELLLSSLDERDPRCLEAQEIRQAAHRGAGLTRQLLSFSRKQVVQPQVVSADSVVSSLANLMRRLIGEDIDLTLITAADDACVKVDPGQLEQVLVNLVVNARDAMPNGGRISLTTSCVEVQSPVIHTNGFVRPGAWVVISVADTGCGMSSEVMSHMFEPFFTTKPPGKGTGLGLSTVYGIVKQSGGHVLAESTVNEGTTFRVYLPQVPEPEWRGRALSKLGAGARGPETILLVEDEDVVRAPLRRILHDAGYEVLCASNGVDALQIAESYAGRIDLLISDVIMPQMGGRELVERLTRERCDLKVLFISGYTGDARDATALGPHSYLQKPFSTTVIRSRVREVLDGVRSRG
jgi:two-component system, cell cycle sensor histidine kinase and response regulator CckA